MREGKPEFIAGCPPDYFSETGQRWGMPIYDFDAQEANGYRFLVQSYELDESLL